MFRKGRKGLTAAVLAALLAAPLGAAEAAGGASGRESMDLWSRLTGWLWAQAGSVTVLWMATDEGPAIDPSGRPTSSTQGDEGPYIDPWG
jgi:hypothetical protein